LLEERGFDEFVEQQCTRFYAERMGRPSLVPGRYFRLLLIGYFEGIEGERGIAWRAADSLGRRSFLGVGLDEQPPDHSTISRTRRLIDVETHQAVFRWVLELLAEKGLLPMNDQNILKRHIQPAARKMGLPFVNWRCLRTSHATWLVQAGADPKSVQGQMRHSRVSTTMDIYAQIVPTAQRRALEQLAEFAKDATPDARSNSRSITVQ
jgi:transposase